MFNTVVRIDINGNLFLPFKTNRFKNNSLDPRNFLNASQDEVTAEVYKLLRAAAARKYLLADLSNTQFEVCNIGMNDYGIIIAIHLFIIEDLGQLNRYDNIQEIAAFIVNCMDIGQLRIFDINVSPARNY